MTARRGKIARLPHDVREELNRRLQDGAGGPPLLAWLNALPAVQTILAEQFDGKPINAQNLSDWRIGGFADWLQHHDRLLRVKGLAEKAAQLARESGGALSEGAAAIAAGRILEVLEAADAGTSPEALGELIKPLVALRAGDHQAQRLKQFQADLERKDEELQLARQKFQRETCELFVRWTADARARDIATANTSNADKIEQLGQLMFGDDWKPAT